MMQTTAPETNQFHLPYENPAVEAFLYIANSAHQQAQAAYQTCVQAMNTNENTTTDLMPAFPKMHESFASGIAYSTKSILLSAEAAYQAQSSVCEALTSATDTAKSQQDLLVTRTQEMKQRIIALEQEAVQLRSKFSQASAPGAETQNYAAEEAQKLLEVLEKAYKQHEMIRKLQERAKETEVNVTYLEQILQKSQDDLANIETLRKRAEEEWDRIIKLFHLDPDSVSGDLLSSRLLISKSQRLQAHDVMEAMEDKEKDKEAESAKPRNEKKHGKVWSAIWSYFKLILLAFLLALLLRTYVVDITKVGGTSMMPTLESNDNLITLKIVYMLNEPENGDIIVLEAPDKPGTDYIKRIIAVPGDELKIEDGAVFVNGEELIEAYLPEGMDTWGSVHTVIPEGYYFVMGDNRADSRDSRTDDVGLISRDAIKGRAVLTVWPFERFGVLE